MSSSKGPTRRVRDTAMFRDGQHCIVCTGRDFLQLHHRRARKMGGSRLPETNEAANLITVCLTCHAWIEEHPELAYERGLLLRQHQTPADVPLIHHGKWVRLDNEGGVATCPQPDEDACTDQTPCPMCPKSGDAA